MTPLLLTDRAERLLCYLAREHAAGRDPSAAETGTALRFGSGNVLHVQTELVRAGAATWTWVPVRGRQCRRLQLTERGMRAGTGKEPIARKRNTMWRAVG